MSSFPEAKILDVDLTSLTVSRRTLPAEIYRQYPGGSALGLYLILQDMKAGVDPLSSDNMLVMAVSAITGLPLSGVNRMAITTKSPLTGTIGDSEAGGFFPANLKANGWDAVVFQGRAPHPVYLHIRGKEAELRSAEAMWGKVTGEAEKLIRQDLGDQDTIIAQIGPAGENLVKYACVISMCSRANGRNGTGAVLGSKNLKAVVVKKAPTPKPVDRERFVELARDASRRLKENLGMADLGKHGTAGILEGFHQEGFLITRNWTSGWFPEGAERITGTAMSETILKKRESCHACTVRCKRVVEVPGSVDPLYGGPEYETCAALGSYCGITNLETVARANQLCNMYGLDTISTGAAIAFAMECFEKGLLTKEDTDGLEVTFGKDEAVPALVEKIALREGLGDLLAEGSQRAAEKIGPEALPFSISVKGQDLPAHMPQGKPSVGLIYAVNPFGADHQSSEHDPILSMPLGTRERDFLCQIGALKVYGDDLLALDAEKVRFAFNSQCFYSLADTLCVCQFVFGPAWQLYGPADLVDVCRYGLGWETSLYELMLVGERRINMMRFFNAREGFTRKDDTLPERLFTPLPDGPSKGACLDREEVEAALDLYYRFAGWDPETGNPTETNLKRLSLEWLLEKQ